MSMANPWRPGEDQIVLSAVKKYGTQQWNRVASLLKRSAAECRARWESELDPAITKSEWTELEDEKLLMLAKSIPGSWLSISSAIKGRTPTQCQERYSVIQGSQSIEGDSKKENDRIKEMAILDNLDDDKRLLEEATARLSSSLGRKAKRKQRERLESELKFLEQVKKHRKSGTSIDLRKLQGMRGLEMNTQAFDLDKKASELNKETSRISKKTNRKIAAPSLEAPHDTSACTVPSNILRQKIKLQLQKLPPPGTASL